MTNLFVDYLNSMNNANSSNENALAEAQILSDYYDRIRIDREVGNHIYKLLFNSEPTAIILTGHAGDGKTSILVQILDKIGYFKEGKRPLKEYDTVDENLFYVKDMSELNKEQQENMILEFLSSPKKKRSSLLISNTGPLINTFKRLIKNKKLASNDNINTFEMDLLDTIDNVESGVKEILSKDGILTYRIINLANIDNSYFIKEIINKLTNEELWLPCNGCENKENCPINFNYRCLINNKENIKDILEKLYLWLSEKETRLTIRQMISHLSFAITANLDCDKIKSKIAYTENPLFTYSFANLLFGYAGGEFINESYNIKAIRELNKLKIDEKAFVKEDNILFVKEDFSCFSEDISSLLQITLEHNMEKLGIDSDKATCMRRAFRRFYILFSKKEKRYKADITQDIFSDVFPLYYQLISNSELDRQDRNKILDFIFNGLYKVFVGVNPECNEEKLYLTFRKNIDTIQNVQLIQGVVRKEQLKIQSSPINMIEKSVKKYKPELLIGDVSYPLNLQTLDYLHKLSEGMIFTSFNPNFTFGISRLKSKLLKEFKLTDKGNIKLLSLKRNGIEVTSLYLDEKLGIE